MLYIEFGCSQIYLIYHNSLFYSFISFYIVNYDDDVYDDDSLTFNRGSLFIYINTVRQCG